MNNSEKCRFNAASQLDDTDICPVRNMRIGEVETRITVVTCPNPVAELHFIKGFKSNPILYAALIDELIQSNINVILVSLPDPLDETHFFEDYEKIAKAVYVEGALDKISPNNPPLIAANHSTGGFLLTKLLMDESNAQKIHDRYEGIVFASPFYGSLYHRHRIFAPISHLYSRLVSDKAIGTTWLERQFYKAATLEPDDDEKSFANHRQALYMDGPTRDLMQDIHYDGFPEIARKIPSVFLIGRNDKVSYNVLTNEVAEKLQSNVYLLDGGHSQVRKTPQGREFLIDFIKDKTQNAYKFTPVFKSIRSKQANDDRPPAAPTPDI